MENGDIPMMWRKKKQKVAVVILMGKYGARVAIPINPVLYFAKEYILRDEAMRSVT